MIMIKICLFIKNKIKLKKYNKNKIIKLILLIKIKSLKQIINRQNKLNKYKILFLLLIK